jgi:hypothetical protein
MVPKVPAAVTHVGVDISQYYRGYDLDAIA